jgi:ubiquinone biosynthesis protein Coq4
MDHITMKINIKERLASLKEVAALAEFLREPDQLDSIFKLAQNMKQSDLASYMHDVLMADASMREMIAERWQPTHYSLQELQNLPEGTLGNAYANQLLALNLSPDDLLPKGEIKTDLDYIQLRLRQTHDIMHVITGFKTNAAGEIGLQAFNLAQIKSPVSALIIFGGILSGLKRKSNSSLDDLLIALSKGFRMGEEAVTLQTQKLEAEWGTNLEELRKRYRVDPA